MNGLNLTAESSSDTRELGLTCDELGYTLPFSHNYVVSAHIDLDWVDTVLQG